MNIIKYFLLFFSLFFGLTDSIYSKPLSKRQMRAIIIAKQKRKIIKAKNKKKHKKKSKKVSKKKTIKSIKKKKQKNKKVAPKIIGLTQIKPIKNNAVNKNIGQKIISKPDLNTALNLKSRDLNSKPIINNIASRKDPKDLPFKSIMDGAQQADGFSCGYWSLFHAYAIEKCINRNEAITTAKLIEYSHEYSHLINNNRHALTDAEITALNESSLNVQNLSLLGSYRANNIDFFNCIKNYQDRSADIDIEHRILMDLYQNDPSIQNALQENHNVDIFNNRQAIDVETEIRLDIIKNAIQNNNLDQAYNFICNLNGGHWVLISVVKYANKNPVFLVVDSGRPKNISASVNNYIHFLSNRLNLI